MSDDLWRRDEPQSPCTRVCIIHEETGLCLGCFRRRAEIAGWGAMSAEAQRDLLAELPGRAALLQRRRGGRARK